MTPANGVPEQPGIAADERSTERFLSVTPVTPLTAIPATAPPTVNAPVEACVVFLCRTPRSHGPDLHVLGWKMTVAEPPTGPRSVRPFVAMVSWSSYVPGESTIVEFVSTCVIA